MRPNAVPARRPAPCRDGLRTWLVPAEPQRFAVLYGVATGCCGALCVAAGLAIAAFPLDPEPLARLTSAHWSLAVFFVVLPVFPAVFGHAMAEPRAAGSGAAWRRMSAVAWFAYLAGGCLLLWSLAAGGVDEFDAGRGAAWLAARSAAVLAVVSLMLNAAGVAVSLARLRRGSPWRPACLGILTGCLLSLAAGPLYLFTLFGGGTAADPVAARRAIALGEYALLACTLPPAAGIVITACTMKRMARISIFLLVCALAAHAAGPARKAFPFEYDMHDFPNGLRLITVPTDFPNVVALYIVVATGSRNEIEPGKSGFAHLFEHMMFRGTDKYPPDRYEAVLKQAGAASNAYTTDDRTVYHTTFSNEDLEKILAMEADRFQHLKYPESVFRTEALAVLGEYNKNSQSPVRQIFEVLRDTAFDKHTYKHTTMGFLRDIKDMPNQYRYSIEFFDRWYRPEYTTIIVAGDVKPGAVRPVVEKHWGGWKRGGYTAAIPAEPPQKGPRSNHIDWPTPTLPWLAVAYRGAAYSDTGRDQVTLDIIGFLGFSESSPLYKKLMIDEQKVDMLAAQNPDKVDPELFTVMARVKKKEDLAGVREEILATLRGFRETPVPAARLEAVRNHLRYRFALGLDNSEAIAGTLAAYIGLRRTPETINKVYALYEQVSPEDIRRVAAKYFDGDSRTIVTLTGGASK